MIGVLEAYVRRGGRAMGRARFADRSRVDVDARMSEAEIGLKGALVESLTPVARCDDAT